MLDRITGRLTEIQNDAAIVSVNGLGYRAHMATSDIAKLSGDVTIYTVLHTRDGDESMLYGFSSERGREIFRALMSVSGVGGKLALAILSFHGTDGVERVILASDDQSMAMVSGVGRKTAQRIILELRDKLGVGQVELNDLTTSRTALAEVAEILRQMDFNSQEVTEAIQQLPTDGDTETLLRHALKSLGTTKDKPAKAKV